VEGLVSRAPVRLGLVLLGLALLCSAPDAQGDRATHALGGVTFVAIPGGEFDMGDTPGDGLPHERPVHRVSLDPFWMASTEVTLRQWKAFLKASGHRPGRSRGLGDDHPVVSVTWDDAKAFCDWFSRTYHVVVRLPTEAEWERAARGGLEGQRYPNGNSLSPADANFAQKGPVRVASYKPNGYGLYDMAGNVFEWVADWYERDYYQRTPLVNPVGPVTAGLQRRADRGGGFCVDAERARVSARHSGPGEWDMGGTADCLGFRPMMEMQGSTRPQFVAK